MAKMNREVFKSILDDYYAKSPPTRFCLAVDFDRTLCYSNFADCGEETPVCKFLRSILDLNFDLVITSCREGENMLTAKKWCRQHGVFWNEWNENTLSKIAYFGNCRKIGYDMLIDDKSYNFTMEDFE